MDCNLRKRDAKMFTFFRMMVMLVCFAVGLGVAYRLNGQGSGGGNSKCCETSGMCKDCVKYGYDPMNKTYWYYDMGATSANDCESTTDSSLSCDTEMVGCTKMNTFRYTDVLCTKNKQSVSAILTFNQCTTSDDPCP